MRPASLKAVAGIGRLTGRVRSEFGRYVRSSSADRPAVRREWGREAFFRLASRYTPTIEAVGPGGRFLVSTSDSVSRAMFVTGPFGLEGDVETCAMVREVLGPQFDLTQGDVLVS